MSAIREVVVHAALNRSYALIDYNIHNNFHKQVEFVQQTVLTDESLTEDEKTYAIRELNKIYDESKVQYNEGTKRTCENCNQECLATLYCEYCVRNYLKENFSNWTSRNNDIDNLIQKCQLETLKPGKIIEWIPYNDLQNIEYLTKGGFSEIYKAYWVNEGGYYEWDSITKQLKRFGNQNVVLKKLENVENANPRWLEEAKSHFTICNKWSEIVPCYGLTQDPSSGNYMLVMNEMDMDLRTYLQQNHYQLTWKERIQIAFEIIVALFRIHFENAIHRDLHPGNMLYLQSNQQFFISDLGFCGPADKSSESIYGNLPYIAPEVISGKGTTKASDIYSIAMLMWEISSGQPPFINHEHNYDLAMNIINGIRPKIVSGTPLEYKNLMKQCWDADPLKRPDNNILWKKMSEIILSYQNVSNKSEINNSSEIGKTNANLETNYTSNRSFTSKVHQFENFPEPRNATEEEQEAFHSNKSYNFNIPDNIDDFGKSSSQKNNILSKMSSTFKVNSKKLSKIFKKKSNNDAQNDYNNREEIMQQQQIKNVVDNNGEDETYNNPNFHSEEQNEFEIPDDMEL